MRDTDFVDITAMDFVENFPSAGDHFPHYSDGTDLSSVHNSRDNVERPAGYDTHFNGFLSMNNENLPNHDHMVAQDLGTEHLNRNDGFTYENNSFANNSPHHERQSVPPHISDAFTYAHHQHETHFDYDQNYANAHAENFAPNDQMNADSFRAKSYATESRSASKDNSYVHYTQTSRTSNHTKPKQGSLRFPHVLSKLAAKHNYAPDDPMVWVKRSFETRRTEVLRIDGKVSPPPDALKIYQMMYVKFASQYLTLANMKGSLVDAMKQSWDKEPPATKRYYEDAAAEEERAHCQAFPSYWAQKTSKGRKRKHEASEEMGYISVSSDTNNNDEPVAKRSRH